MIQAFECKYCGVKFQKAGTLATHLCVKKRRHMELDSPESRFGFRTFQRFFVITSSSKSPKSTQEFIESPYYIDFVKFGNHLAKLRPVYSDKFIDYVISTGVKLKDWTKDAVYYAYIDDLIKKEPADAATERTITEMIEWTTANRTNFTSFFNDVSANEASHMIRTGKISPWVLYLSETGGTLLDRFTEDHATVIGSIIDPGLWMKKFKTSKADVDYIKTLLTQSGL